MTLMELTGHESGIIVYDGKTVGVWNWNQCGDHEMPLLSPIGTPINWEENEDVFEGVKDYRFADGRKELPGSVWLTGEKDEDGTALADTNLDIVYDVFGDIVRLFCDKLPAEEFEGTAYVLRDGRKILVFDMWN